MRIYLRHSYKAHNNRQGNCDPELTPAGVVYATTRFQELYETYQAPTVTVVASPYLRTRQTAKILAEMYQVTVDYDYRLGEYLGNWQGYRLRDLVTPETLALGAKLYGYRKYMQVLRTHLADAEAVDTPDCLTWYITHGLTITYIAKIYQTRVPYPDELHGIIIDNEMLYLI